MYKSILIPTDGSELSRTAIETGVALAKALGARVVGIAVVLPSGDFAVGEFGLVSDPAEFTKANALSADRNLAVISEVAKNAHVAAETLQIGHDSPWKAIVETAASKGCDLIVMASHGRKGLDALVIGSETNKVLTHSKIPVLVTR